MAKFKVTFDAWWDDIEADDEDDAASIAWDYLNNGDYIPDVEEIDEPTNRQRTVNQKNIDAVTRLFDIEQTTDEQSADLTVEQFLWSLRSDD